MIIMDEMTNLRVYRKPLWLPTVESDKKKKSAVFLLTPNFTSSKNVMLNPLLINKKRFESYYIEKDLTYFIKSDKAQMVTDVSESYVRDYTEYDTYQHLIEMTAAERKKLPDHKFGLPKKRKYPLDTSAHVLSAIKFFNYVTKEDEAELAKNINKAIPKLFDSGEYPSVGENNRFKKYYKIQESIQESFVITEASREEIVNKAIKGFEDLGLKPKVSASDKKKFIKGEKLDFGKSLCITNLGNSSLVANCSKVNKIIKPLGARVSADNYGSAFLSINEGKLLKVDLNAVSVEREYGIWDKRGLYNACVKLAGVKKPLRGRSEVLIIKGDSVFLDMKPGNRGYRLPGGGWDEYEDHLLSARREAKEEARIIIKNPLYIGHYVDMYDTPKDWVKEQIPEKDWWYGYYTELYVAEYDKTYNGRVEVLDRDTMADTGKFYPIEEVYKKLRPVHQRAIKQFTGKEYSTLYVRESFMKNESADKSILDKNFKKKSGKKFSFIDIKSNRAIAERYLSKDNDYNSIYKEYIDKISGEVVVDTETDRLAGYVFIIDKFITPLYVVKKYRGYGLGDTLTKNAISKHGAKRLWVYRDNEVAIKLYEKHGFKTYLDDDEPSILMATDSKSAKEVIDSLNNKIKESVNQNLSDFNYYHGEIVRKGFNPTTHRGGWDEELYSKNIPMCINNDGKWSHYRDKSADKFQMHLYTIGEDYAAIYLGIIDVFVHKDKDGNEKFDWEWAEQEDIDQSLINYLKDEVQKGEYTVSEACMETTEELCQVAELVQKMVMKNPYFTPMKDFVELEDGLIIGSVDDEASKPISIVLNEKLKASIMCNYHTEVRSAGIGADYLVVFRNDPSTYVSSEEELEELQDKIFASTKDLAESTILGEDSSWVQSIYPINTPETAIRSVSAIVSNSDHEWLLLDHVKCDAYTLPGGKLDPGETEEEAIHRELKEELGIAPVNYHKYYTSTFLCNYPKGSDNFVYFTDTCYFIDGYSGTIKNKEINKHRCIEYINPHQIISSLCGADRKGISTLLQTILAHHEIFTMNNCRIGNTMVEDNDITYSGYEKEAQILCTIAHPMVYKEIITALRLPDIVKHEDIPVIHLDPGKKFDIKYRDFDGRIHIYISIEMNFDENGRLMSPRVVIESAIYLMILGVLEAKYPASRNTVLPSMIADYLCGGLGTVPQYNYDLIHHYVNNRGLSGFTALLPMGDVTSLFKYAKHVGFDTNGVSDFIRESGTHITADNIANKIKYATTTKIKRKIGVVKNKAKNLTNSIIDDIQQKTQINIPTFTGGSTSTTDTEVENEAYKELLNITHESNEFVRYGDLITVFEDAKYDSKLRSILYTDRIVQRKEIDLLYDRAKKECPFIRYTYPDINRYNQKNLFVDLYYYNEVFFKNNDWKSAKGFELYFDLLDRLVNDKRIKSAGYEKKTIFIPVLDWDRNKSTRMWIYREDINPISIIYHCMVNDPARLKKIFGKMDLVFFGRGLYFKMNFSKMEDIKKSAVKFQIFIKKIRNNEDFDAGDEDITTKETPKAIQTDIIDKIETSKGVDLTPNLHKVQSTKNQTGSKDPIPVIKRGESKDEPRSEVNDQKTEESNEKSKLSKEQPIEQKSVEKNKDELAQLIDDITSDDSNRDTEEALDKMDSEYARELLLGLDSHDDEVKISAARADRMMELDRNLLDKQIKGKSVKDILKEEKVQAPLDKTELKISSPNEQWKELQYINFGKTYHVDADIIRAFQHFSTVSHPLSVRDMTVTNNSTSEDRLDLYTVSLEDYRGTRYTVKLDIPVEKNKRYLLRGGDRNIQTQFCNMPIIKTDLNSCQVVSNYNKIIVERFNTSAGRSLPQASRFIKAANKYEGKKITFITGDNSQICAKYNLPIDYIDLASVFSRIETEDFIIYFNQDEIRKLHNVDETYGIPYAYKKKEKTILYMDKRLFSIYDCFTTGMLYALFYQEESKYKEFIDLYYQAKPVNRGTYSRASIMSSDIPLVVVCAYSEGLTSVLKKANIQYRLMDKLDSETKKNPSNDYIKFKDGYIVFTANYNASLLLNGLKDCSTEMYSITEIDDRNMYLDFLDNFGGRIKADGLDNAYDCTIDPITKEMLEFYKLPTDYITVLLYTNILLSDNKFIRHTDTSSRRIRREELIAAYTYKVLAEAYRTYANEIKHGGSRNGFSVKQSAVVDKFLLDTTSSDSSVINMLNDVESTNSITTKGLSGMNSERAYSLDKRTYDESMLNVLAMSTGFSANVGITRQATMNMNIESNRGFVKSIDGDTKKMNTANTLSATEALIPMSTTHDDPIRVAMSFIQTSKHTVRTTESDPLLVTNGADEALPFIASDLFAHKAKYDGVIKEITDDLIIVEYKNGEKEYIDISETIQKNSDGGFYVPLKLDLNPKFKEGSKVKPGDIIAFDQQSISNSIGESDNLAYNVGKLAKVAIINTDDGFEDSGIVTESMSHKLGTRIIEKMETDLDKNTNIFNLIRVGSHVEEGDTLLVWQTPYEEEDASAILKVMANDKEAVSELGRHTVKSKLTGTVVGIKVYRTVELEELSESLRKVVEAYEKPIKSLKKKLDNEGIDSSTLPPTYPLDPIGKLKNTGEGVKIEFYVEYLDIVAVGDKLTYNAANKVTIKRVLPADLTPTSDFRPNEPIDALVSTTSIAKRMVSSVPVYGALQKLMVELDRTCKDLAGIPYDDSTV